MALRAAAAVAVTAAALAAASSASAVTAASVTRVAGGGTVATSAIATTAPYTLALEANFDSLGGIGLANDDILGADYTAVRIFRFTPGGAILRTAGSFVGSSCGTTADDATYSGPADVVAFGSLYLIADNPSDHICQVNSGTGAAATFAGTTEGWVEGNATTTAKFNGPVDLEPFSGGVLIADFVNHAIRKYVSGTVSTVAGAPTNNTPPAEPPATLSDATAADIGLPHAVSAISESHYFIANEFQVLEVDAGKIKRVAGGGANPTPVDGDQATSINFNPGGVQALRGGDFLVYDDIGNRILRVSGGVISTLAGGLASGGTFALSDHALYVAQNDTVARILATEIVSGPADGSHVGTGDAQFGFASWDEHATFACSVDSPSSYGPCGTVTGRGEGKHQIYVKATTDTNRVDPAPVRRDWYVDLSPPGAFGLLGPDDGATTGDPKPVFSWERTTDGSTVVQSGLDHYDLVVDGVTVATVDPGGCSTTCAAAVPNALPDGARSWEVHAVDKVGHARVSGPRTIVIASPPVAALTLAPARALAGRTVTFDASASTDANGSIVKYEWDFDGDGTFDADTGASPTTTKSYPAPATLEPKVRVTDSGGLSAVAQASLVVSAQAPAGKPLGVSVNDGAQFTNDPDVTIFAVWPSFASNAFVSNDGGFKAGQIFPVAEKIPWKLDSSGPERLPKTVYVRFTAGPQVSETYTDDIILDQTPPKVLSASLPSGPGAASAAAARKVKLKIKARDNVSGVGAAQVTKNKRKPGRFLRFKKTLKVAPAKRLYVRVRDRAGNLSAWRVAKRR
jgi:hypothetical protein